MVRSGELDPVDRLTTPLDPELLQLRAVEPQRFTGAGSTAAPTGAVGRSENGARLLGGGTRHSLRGDATTNDDSPAADHSQSFIDRPKAKGVAPLVAGEDEEDETVSAFLEVVR